MSEGRLASSLSPAEAESVVQTLIVRFSAARLSILGRRAAVCVVFPTEKINTARAKWQIIDDANPVFVQCFTLLQKQDFYAMSPDDELMIYAHVFYGNAKFCAAHTVIKKRAVIDETKIMLSEVADTKHRPCALCGREDEADVRCGRCKQVYYCGSGHQNAHWGVHRGMCPSGGGAAASRRALDMPD